MDIHRTLKQSVENLNSAFLYRLQSIYKIFLVDVDFVENFVVECRPNSKKVVDSTKRWTPPGPPPLHKGLSVPCVSFHAVRSTSSLVLVYVFCTDIRSEDTQA